MGFWDSIGEVLKDRVIQCADVVSDTIAAPFDTLDSAFKFTTGSGITKSGKKPSEELREITRS